MDAVTREHLMALDRAMEAEDEDLIMELEGVDRITARFMIGVGKGRITDGEIDAPGVPPEADDAIAPAVRPT